MTHWLDFDLVSRRIQAIAATPVSDDGSLAVGRRASLKQQRSKRGAKIPPAALQLSKILEQASAALADIKQIAQRFPWGICITIDSLEACLIDCEARYIKCFPAFPRDESMHSSQVPSSSS